jgi:stage II sporulation protein M
MVPIKEFSQRIKPLLKRDWPLFLIMLLLFLSGIWLGGQMSQANPSMAKSIEKLVNNKFGSMKQWLKDMPFFVWIFVIWFNNIIASVTSFLSGILVIFPPGFVIYQGVILGVVQKLTETSHMSHAKFYLSLVPHGIFELSAVFIASGLGIRFGLVLYRSLWSLLKGEDNKGLLKNFFDEMRVYSIFIILMLFVAAIIEVTISPLIIQANI